MEIFLLSLHYLTLLCSISYHRPPTHRWPVILLYKQGVGFLTALIALIYNFVKSFKRAK